MADRGGEEVVEGSPPKRLNWPISASSPSCLAEDPMLVVVSSDGSMTICGNRGVPVASFSGIDTSSVDEDEDGGNDEEDEARTARDRKITGMMDGGEMTDESRAARELMFYDEEFYLGEHEAEEDENESMAARELMFYDEEFYLGEHEAEEDENESMAARELKFAEQLAKEMAELRCGEIEDGEDEEEQEDEMAGCDSSSISKQQIEELCEQMEAIVSFLRLKIKPAAPLRSSTSSSGETAGDDALGIKIILEQFADLRGGMSKLRKQLIPFKEKYEREDEIVGDEDEEERARKEMVTEERIFDDYRCGTESSCDIEHFEHITALSPMQFTHYTPGRSLPYYASKGTSLQVYSLKIADVTCKLGWPLFVYGVVAARDNVDRKRNILFYRPRRHCQILNRDDPFLRLTGPSRAILASDPVNFEVQLKIKGVAETSDKALMNRTSHYSGSNKGIVTFRNSLCTAELRLEKLVDSVQATFLGVRVVDGLPCAFEYGGRVICSSPPHDAVMDSQCTGRVIGPPPTQVVLLDSLDSDGGKMPMGEGGYLDLSRRVVSVELQTRSKDSQEPKESLKVVIQAYSQCGKIGAEAHAMFIPKSCNTSSYTCVLGSSHVEITIAWSAILSTNRIFS